MIPLFKVAMSEKASALVGEVLDSGYIGQGTKVDELEHALAKRLDNPRVLTVSSATAGLHLALHLIATEHGRDGEVLATPLTCTATNWPILANGMKIRWVDTDPETLNIDLDDLARKITPTTRAIVLVHWGGYPVDLDRLTHILDEAERLHGNRPQVIEDCADAFGATYKNAPLGNHGNIAVYSFQAVKHLTTGDGGLLVLPNDHLLERARLLRWYGIDRNSGPNPYQNDITEYGFKANMNDINAAIGLANLDIIDTNLAKHRENAAYYDSELANTPDLELTERAPDRNPSFMYYTVKVKNRTAFTQHLKSNGIATSEVHKRNDHYTTTHPYSTHLPNLDTLTHQHISIPVGWWLTPTDLTHISRTIKKGW
ncbi:DegT/DnrJ/EryC1/StrS family aminotransferase [Streptomyces clavifer]|uniref:DegT/DnrJ/EryC1/StrS family aminotransferase n=1 Tax=Streptomyces clavifer TaxID=68188 RepID=UPI002E80EB8E|nr:DegT/DnrJ/EryC1/StrS family aminotransferase [Streptomyces clavifer]WUC31864.1 DegT/DnrJ/EryC1/StrS family aminotransferase [Streptomyces clavifer]